MQAESAANLFQTDADLALAAARADQLAQTRDLGRPVALPSKALALLVDGDDAWVAESGFVVRRIDLESGKTRQLYKGHAGPVTALALWRPAPNAPPLLFSGSWDKTVRVWDTATATPLLTLSPHADFLKTLVVVPHRAHPLLLSGSSDKTLRVHDLAPFLAAGAHKEVKTLECVQVVKEHTRPVTCLALVPPPEEDDADARAPAVVEVVSADSLGRSIVWVVDYPATEAGGAGAPHARLREVRRLKDAATSVTAVWAVEDGIWTASMDHSTTFHPRPSLSLPPCALPSLPAPSPSPLALLPLPTSLLLTSSTDGLLRLYSLAEGEAHATLLRGQEGHVGEVGGLAGWARKGEEGGVWVVSAGLDRTVRRWKLADLLNPPPPPPPANPTPAPPLPGTAANADPAADASAVGPNGLTADEERELAELMGSDEDA